MGNLATTGPSSPHADPPDPDPLVQLASDQARARAGQDPCVDRCSLATVTRDGEPRVRTLVLHGVENGRLELYFNATSPKWRQLEANGKYELLVYWPTIGRQYRLSGGLDEIPWETMAERWRRRESAGKQLDLYYSIHLPQSSVIEDADAYARAMKGIGAELAKGGCPEAPGSIHGLRLLPRRIEFLDVGAVNRIHRRYLYTGGSGDWIRQPLVP